MNDVDQNVDQLSDAARARMQRWLTSPGLRQHLDQAFDTGRRPARTGPYIAISREAGSGGAAIAAQLAEQLGWDVLDKEVLDVMARRFGMRRGMLELVDEKRATWIHDMLSSFLDAQVVSQEKFVVRMERVVVLAAMYGNVVFVGRGAHCILPRCSGLAVRLVAPLEYRIARRMDQHGITRQQAARQIARTDAERDEFYRTYFHQECGDPHRFDLTINVAQFSPANVCELIIQAYDRIPHETSPPRRVAR